MKLTSPRPFGSRTRLVIVGAIASMVVVAVGLAPAGAASKHKQGSISNPALRHDVSPPLTDLSPAPSQSDDGKKEKEPKQGLPVPRGNTGADPVVQNKLGAASAPALGVGFEAI